MTGGKIALLVTGVVLAFIGFALAAGGGAMLWAHSTQRDAEGYVTSPRYQFQTEGYALTAEQIHLGAVPRGERVPGIGRFAVRLDVESSGARPVFVGVAREADVDVYLQGVAHSEITRLDAPGGGASYRTEPGTATPAPPTEQDFWEASAEGTGPQRLTWRTEPGAWAVVVMNSDATPGVAVDASAAAQAGFLLPLAVGLLIAGLFLLAAATVLIVAATAGGGRGAPGGAAATGGAGTPPADRAAATAGARRYPVAIEGHLDQPLNRGLWLVKWLLLIPHVIVLVLLWLAFVLLTVVAGFAILLTGRYPGGIFDFNVGVIRWTWRVMYYGYSALGTDRYPPFTLDAVDYPATFDVAYPQRLSRGLVLIKWWLLAIPHYLIVALFAGGGLSWTVEGWGDVEFNLGGGLIGLLVIIAGIVLLFTARYPRGLFDFIMGLNRWVYRVLAYVALMTDEYPPFRFDPGGAEPQPAPQPPSGGPSQGGYVGGELARTGGGR
jgi:hypothetical protein